MSSPSAPAPHLGEFVPATASRSGSGRGAAEVTSGRRWSASAWPPVRAIFDDVEAAEVGSAEAIRERALTASVDFARLFP
jgi:hypothetical protein